MQRWDDVIRRIHSGAYQAVLAVTGGGSRAISDLLAVPGASRFLLEAVVPYSPQAIDSWLTRKPDSSCSRETALQMAAAAWTRANQLADSATPIIGVACTASLVSQQPKRGLERHQAHYGAMPRQIAADGGCATAANLTDAKDAGVEDVATTKRAR